VIKESVQIKKACLPAQERIIYLLVLLLLLTTHPSFGQLSLSFSHPSLYLYTHPILSHPSLSLPHIPLIAIYPSWPPIPILATNRSHSHLSLSWPPIPFLSHTPLSWPIIPPLSTHPSS
jgi:hypothetical protein